MTTLTLEHVSIDTLHDIGFAVGAGEVVCLSGPSGSGKSRLLRAIADLEAHAGRIFLEDREQGAVPAHDWRRQAMMVPADSQWWFDEVGAHFSGAPEWPPVLGLSREVLAWPVSRLSSGERQRLALMRALHYGPRALLLDEPTANLDEAMTQAVEGWLLEEIHTRQLPVIWVAHDTGQIRRVASRHYRIHGATLEQVHGRH